MADWQKIETAPKDGTMILLWCAPASMVIGRWEREASFGDGREDAPGWQVFNCEEDPWYSWAWQADTPTHWQPLPSPPTED